MLANTDIDKIMQAVLPLCFGIFLGVIMSKHLSEDFALMEAAKNTDAVCRASSLTPSVKFEGGVLTAKCTTVPLERTNYVMKKEN